MSSGPGERIPAAVVVRRRGGQCALPRSLAAPPATSGTRRAVRTRVVSPRAGAVTLRRMSRRGSGPRTAFDLGDSLASGIGLVAAAEWMICAD